MSRSRLATFLLSMSLLAGCGSAAVRGNDAHVAGPDPIVAQGGSIDRAQLRSALAARRQQSLDRFLAYREGRVYPINTFDAGLQHVWRDDAGHLCAAATTRPAAPFNPRRQSGPPAGSGRWRSPRG